MKKTVFIISCFLIFFTALKSHGETYLGTLGWGDPVPGHSAASLGMGGISVATEKSAFAVMANPALLTRFERSHLSVSLLPYVLNEERSRAIYDKFSQRVYNVYAANTNISMQNIATAVVYPLKKSLPLLGDIAVGAGLAPVYDLSYRFERTERDKNYVVTSATKTDNSGTINKMAVSLALNPVSWLNIGFSYNLFSGAANAGTETTYPLAISQNYKSSALNSYGGGSISAGLLVEINPHISAGLNYQTSAKITQKQKININGANYPETSRDLVYPSVISAGVEYKPRNLIAARLGADVVYTRWGDDFRVSDAKDASLRNTLEVKFGVEHYIKEITPVRFGLSYTPWYGNKNTNTVLFTAGTGAVYKKAKFDISGGVGKRDYYIGVPNSEPDLYEEFFTQLGLSVGYLF